MSRSDINIKTCSVDNTRSEQEINQTEQNSSNKSLPITSENDSSFTISSKNQWQAMTSSSTPIGEMMDAINGVEQPSSFKGPRDALLARFDSSDANVQERQAAAGASLPPVPKLQDLFNESPHIQDNMESTVNKYKLIQETLDGLLKNAYETLGEKINANEAIATQDSIIAIEERLAENDRELALANYYYELQQQREKIAQELTIDQVEAERETALEEARSESEPEITGG